MHELGQNTTIYPDDLGILLPANSVLTWRMHTHANGKETQVRIDLGFKLHPKGYKPKHVLMARPAAWRTTTSISRPATTTCGSTRTWCSRSLSRFVSFEPHMHASGKRMCLEAILPERRPVRRSTAPGTTTTG